MTAVLCVAEMRPWRCHAPHLGLGMVTAREMIGADIVRYRIETEPGRVTFWMPAELVTPAAESVVSFPYNRIVFEAVR